jgi:peptidoglycan/LPS O-acetylase OafA/YrhL
MLTKTNYRPEIDGLRAVSVFAVMLYHGHFGVPGGFVGVDVFFVISGFLIASIIFEDIDNNKFTLLGFWERRVRRIIPALVMALLFCWVIGGFLLLPKELKELGKVSLFQSVFASNIHYWRSQGDYFASPATFQPLLHLWSLALEEQFYLFFPLLIWGIQKGGRRSSLIAVIASISLVFAVLQSGSHPLAAFYLLPHRAWELLMGAALASSARSLPVGTKVQREAISFLGLAAIVFSMFSYGDSTPWPSYRALLPCLGTVAIIWGTPNGSTWCGRLLSLNALTWSGIRSYSLYLLHWPLLVFINVWSVGPAPWWLRGLGLIFTFPLAMLSFQFIETPIRRNKLFQNQAGILVFGVTTLAGILLVGGLIHFNDGFPGRFPKAALKVLEEEPNSQDARFRDADLTDAINGTFPIIGSNVTEDASILVWGDSHARTITPAIESLSLQYGAPVVRVVKSGCPPILGHGPAEEVDYNARIFEYIKVHKILRVILASRWELTLKTQDARDKFAWTVARLSDAGVTTWILKQVPEQSFDVPRAMARFHLLGQNPDPKILTYHEHKMKQSIQEALFDLMTKQGKTSVLDPTPYFFDGAGICKIEKDGHLLYFDSNHLGHYGALYIKPLFEPVFM